MTTECNGTYPFAHYYFFPFHSPSGTPFPPPIVQ
jgi:hypothetical protein